MFAAAVPSFDSTIPIDSYQRSDAYYIRGDDDNSRRLVLCLVGAGAASGAGEMSQITSLRRKLLSVHARIFIEVCEETLNPKLPTSFDVGSTNRVLTNRCVDLLQSFARWF